MITGIGIRISDHIQRFPVRGGLIIFIQQINSGSDRCVQVTGHGGNILHHMIFFNIEDVCGIYRGVEQGRVQDLCGQVIIFQNFHVIHVPEIFPRDEFKGLRILKVLVIIRQIKIAVRPPLGTPAVPDDPGTVGRRLMSFREALFRESIIPADDRDRVAGPFHFIGVLGIDHRIGPREVQITPVCIPFFFIQLNQFVIRHAKIRRVEHLHQLITVHAVHIV